MESNTEGLGEDIGPKVYFVFGHGGEELDEPRKILEEDCKLVVKAECGVDTKSEAADFDTTYHILQIQDPLVLLDPFYNLIYLYLLYIIISYYGIICILLNYH